MTDIRNTDDLINSRDVIARIEELIELSQGEDWTIEDNDELTSLQALAKQGEDYAPDWSYGETMIHDGYFQEYAEQLADDIGAINSEARWPNNCIDWERAANELKQDYTSIDFDGETYWIR